MDELKVLIDYGNLSPDSRLYFRFTDWCGTQKFELRYWGCEGTQPFDNEVKFTRKELQELYYILKDALCTPKASIPFFVTKKENTFVKILNYYGEIKGWTNFQVTYTSWNDVEKYDIRHWEENFSDCWKGVRMTEEECENFVHILAKEFEKDEEPTEEEIDIYLEDMKILIKSNSEIAKNVKKYVLSKRNLNDK